MNKLCFGVQNQRDSGAQFTGSFVVNDDNEQSGRVKSVSTYRPYTTPEMSSDLLQALRRIFWLCKGKIRGIVSGPRGCWMFGHGGFDRVIRVYEEGRALVILPT